MDVSIILTNYMTSSLAKDAIESIKNVSFDFEYEIIIVDNSNNQEEFEKLLELEKLDVKVINANSDLGFGNGNNLGVKYAIGKWLFFINTDTIMVNNAIKELLDFYKTHDNVGILGANLYNRDMKANHSFMLKEKNIKNDIKFNSVFTSFKRWLTKKREDFNYSNNPILINGFVCGAAFLISKEDFDKLGGFEKEIFMYAEESLLCYRVIHELKKNIYNIPSAKVIHFEGGSFKVTSSFNAKSFIDGNFIYYKKVFGYEEAIKMVQKLKKSYSRKKKLFFLLNKKNKVLNYKNLELACINKLEVENK